MNTRDRIVSALTQYDARQSKRGRQWNPYGLAIYLEALERAEALVAKGRSWEAALMECFCDRVLDVVLKAATR